MKKERAYSDDSENENSVLWGKQECISGVNQRHTEGQNHAEAACTEFCMKWVASELLV